AQTHRRHHVRDIPHHFSSIFLCPLLHREACTRSVHLNLSLGASATKTCSREIYAKITSAATLNNVDLTKSIHFKSCLMSFQRMVTTLTGTDDQIGRYQYI
ncbi:hypothetical protein BDQ17DRAFT_1373668, partial [Cyathus striatus]